MTKKAFLALLLLLILLFAGTYYYLTHYHAKNQLRVFHAGSLSLPFEYLENRFEENHSAVDVQRVIGGSAKLVRSVVDLNKRCDLLAVADYSLIKEELMPDHAAWYINFARDRLVLAYTESSRWGNEINDTNWYEILRKAEVVFGFSSPNDDPCGYRALMVIQLAEIYYNDFEIFDDLIVDNTAITAKESNGTYTIIAPEHISPNPNKLLIRTKSIDLIHLLQSEELDYAFEYQSVAIQHGLKFLTLPEQIDLSNTSYEAVYSKVNVNRFLGETVTGETIVYSLTIPKNAEHRELAISFVKLLLEEYRNGNLDTYGQPAIVPALASNKNALPQELKGYVI